MSSQTIKIIVCGTTGVVLGAVASGALLKITKQFSECLFNSSCAELDAIAKKHPCLVSDTSMQLVTADLVPVFAWYTWTSANCVIDQLSNLNNVLDADTCVGLIGNTAGVTMNVLLGSNNTACGLWLLHDSTKTLYEMNYPYCDIPSKNN